VSRTCNGDQSRRPTAPHHLLRLVLAQQTVGSTHDERRRADAFPRLPPGDRVDVRQRLLEHVGVPSRPQPVDAHVETVGPGPRNRRAPTEELDERVPVREGRRPAVQPPGNRRGGLRTAAPNAALDQHEPAHQVRSLGGHEKCGARAHRLTDEIDRADLGSLDE